MDDQNQQPVLSLPLQSNMKRASIREDWQYAFADAFKDVNQLLHYLNFSERELKHIECGTNPKLPCRVPLSFAKRMKPRDPHDPLLRQVLLLGKSKIATKLQFFEDPVGDRCAQREGLLKKYEGRALMLIKGQCAIHCQYCFRQNFPYQSIDMTVAGWRKSIDAIAQDPSIQEVILSGGDPLLIRDDHLSTLLDWLETIPTLKSIRIHTRCPVAIPSRITPKLCQRLSNGKVPIITVIHSNHPNEIDVDLRNHLRMMKSHGLLVLNQSVLLKGVNDNLQTLVDLSNQLLDAGVLPYYLHLLDRVAGSERYWVSDRRARQLMRGLLQQLPGYLVPRFVREVPAIPHKVPLRL